MIEFQYPELFLLAIPLWFAFRRWGRVSGVTGWLRLALVVVLLLSLTGPELNVGGRGIDVIVLADRSRSIPADADSNIHELIENLQRNRGPGDRVGLVAFASQAHVEYVLSNQKLQQDFTKEVNPDGSDLNDAVTTALNLVDPDRPARILVLSDGEANGGSPLSAARRAHEQQVPIDFRLFERVRIGDVAVDSILLPESVSPREPFQFAVWVYADRAAQGTVTVLRDGEELSTVQNDFTPGMNRLLFRDVLEQGGFYNYSVRLETEKDPIRENNTGAGVVRVDAGPRLLVLNADGAEGNLVGALRAGRVPVDVAVANQHPLTQDALDPYRAVVVENVPAADLGRRKMERLAQFVEDLGGGLMLTGGERSFGSGGFFKSPLDELLPVSMEMREEHRKTRVAMVVALDRSGSMAVSVSGGKTKMDLANLGTAECVRMLSPADKIAVIAVDSTPHVIQPLTAVNDPEAIAEKALTIESMGGGIFVYDALVAAGNELAKAEGYQTRHIILFSDAADSERPGSYTQLLKKFADSGITVSVIGLGTKADTDARLLEDIAKRGSGNILFTNDPQELPRLFTQDTMSVARNTFVKKDPESQPAGIPGQILPDTRLMGELGQGVFPHVDGYNLTYLREEATGAVVTQDEYAAPLSAFWFRGLGRVAAMTLEVDGQYSGRFGRWEHYEDFLLTHARWLVGGDNPDEVFVSTERDGQDAVATIELDPERNVGTAAGPPELVVVPPGQERERVIKPDFVWTGPNTLQARFRMQSTGTYRTLVKTGKREFTRGPAVTLPYSPEYVPRAGLPSGKEVLTEMAGMTGGVERTDILKVFDEPPRAARTLPLLPWLCLAGIALLLVEIAGRRLSLWERFSDAVTPEAGPAKRRAWLPEWKWPVRQRRKTPAPQVRERAAGASTAESSPTATPDKPAKKGDQPPGRSASDVFTQAKNRAKRRLK